MTFQKKNMTCPKTIMRTEMRSEKKQNRINETQTLNISKSFEINKCIA